MGDAADDKAFHAVLVHKLLALERPQITPQMVTLLRDPRFFAAFLAPLTRPRAGGEQAPAVQAVDPVDDQAVGADAVDVGAELDQEPRQVLHVRLARRVQDHGLARRQRRAQERILPGQVCPQQRSASDLVHMQSIAVEALSRCTCTRLRSTMIVRC